MGIFMNTYNKIIFVCTGNTCRSPMAATIMQHNLMGMDISVESRGMVVLFPEPYNPKAVAVAANHGMIMPSNNAIQIENSDFDKETLVLVMDSSMKAKLYNNYEKAINVYTINEFVGWDYVEINDPYGKGIEEYHKCFDTLLELVNVAAEIIINNMNEKQKDEG